MATKAELEAELAALKEQLAAKETAVEVAPLEVKAETHPAPVEPTVPVPSAFSEAVKTILNDKFTIDIGYEAERPVFSFAVLVPKEYSNAGAPHWELYKEDRRVKIVSNEDGVHGVKQWLEKVYNNFDNETKARITSDRTK